MEKRVKYAKIKREIEMITYESPHVEAVQLIEMENLFHIV